MTDFKLDRRQALSLFTMAPIALGSSKLLAAPQNAHSASQASSPPALQEANWTQPLSDYIAGSQTARIPEEIRELARRHILDSLAAAVACRDLDAAVLARQFTKVQSGGAKVATVLGTREKRSLLDAIFASGMTIHAAEINDFCPSAFTQPSASIIPVTLALGERYKLPGEAMLRAVIVGYEIACRMPKALGIRNLQLGRMANHSIGPMFGSAAAAASLIGLPRDRLVDMFSYCVQQASGSWQWLRDVEHVEKAFVFGGMPARRGAECALMVEAGFTGMGDPFREDPGWLNSTVFTRPESDFNPGYLTEKLGERFELPLVGYKRYPVGGPTQPVIELMLGFIQDLPREKVRHVRIEMPGRTDAFATAEMPALNLPYLCSIILADGKLDFVAAQSRDRFLNDNAIRAFMKNVEVIHDPAQEAEPRIESARVILTLEDGSRHERFIDHVKGFPAHPFDRDDVQNKALELTVPHLGEKRAQQLVDAVWNIERMKNVGELVKLIAR